MSSYSVVLTGSDGNMIWKGYMRECRGYLDRVDFDRIIREVYIEIPSPTSNADLESSSSGFSDIHMEAT